MIPLNELLASYLPIVIFVGVALLIGVALLVSPFLLAFKAPDDEKLSAYECGFNAVSYTHLTLPTTPYV